MIKKKKNVDRLPANPNVETQINKFSATCSLGLVFVFDCGRNQKIHKYGKC